MSFLMMRHPRGTHCHHVMPNCIANAKRSQVQAVTVAYQGHCLTFSGRKLRRVLIGSSVRLQSACTRSHVAPPVDVGGKTDFPHPLPRLDPGPDQMPPRRKSPHLIRLTYFPPCPNQFSTPTSPITPRHNRYPNPPDTMLRLAYTRAARHVAQRAPCRPSMSLPAHRFCTSAKKSGTSTSTPTPTSTAMDTDDDTVLTDEDNVLEGLETGRLIKESLRARAADAVRFEYLAQRADIEAEVEAAQLLRGLGEAARQQAMGFLELQEEYGDAAFATTADNLGQAAETERAAAASMLAAAQTAGKDDLAHVEEWFDDLSDAANRAANKLDALADDLVEDAVHADGEQEEGEAQR